MGHYRLQAEIVYDFARTTGITRSEAKYYLDEHGFDVDKWVVSDPTEPTFVCGVNSRVCCVRRAKAMLKGDVSWEQAQKQQQQHHVKAEAGEALRRRLKAF